MHEAEGGNYWHCTHLQWCLSTIVLAIRGKFDLCMHSGEPTFICMLLSSSVELSFGERQASWQAEYIRETQRTRLASNFRCSSLVACLTILAEIRDYSTHSKLVSNEILVTK